MNRQMSAERDRRAQVTASTGQKEATVTIADGDKQAAILRAEGEKRSAILTAEGAREAQLLRAEGYAKALEKIFSAAKNIDQKTMTLQYFETLKEMGASPATKYIFPMEFTSMISDFISGQKKK
jgi:regulator of protease activity HflC (stomatin/prohibitin superfamily)